MIIASSKPKPSRIPLKILVVSAVVAGVSLATASPEAHALRADQAPARLVVADLRPIPLFPALVPNELANAQAKVRHRGRYFSVEWTECCDRDDALLTILSFSREPASALRQALRLRKTRGDRIHKIRVGQRVVYSFDTGHYIGYMWRTQGMTYILSSHCCLSGPVNRRVLSVMVRNTVPLGSVYAGRTSEGLPMTLHHTVLGVDYYIQWKGKCEDEREREIAYTVAAPRACPLDAQGRFSEQASYSIGDSGYDERHQIGMFGALAGPEASGAWQADVVGFDDNGEYRCTTGPVSWKASRVG